VDGVNLPDTIIFERGTPVTWYFSLNSVITRKRKDAMTLESIFEKLTRKVVAQS